MIPSTKTLSANLNDGKYQIIRRDVVGVYSRLLDSIRHIIYACMIEQKNGFPKVKVGCRHHLLVTGLGVGVHRMRFRSVSFFALPSHPAILPIASALLAAAVPMVDLSSSLLAAGVNAPWAPDLRGVHEGGGMALFRELELADAREIPGTLRSPALARKLFAAFVDNLCEMRSRAEGAKIWKGVFGVPGDGSAGSSDWDRIRGVAFRVPHVMSCFIAIGPNSDGVGEGTAGTSEKLSPVGDLGRSTSPQ